MTTIKTISILIAAILLSSAAVAQSSQKSDSKKGKFRETTIKTSSQCDMCKERIEEALAFERGVKKSELDLETNVITVTFHPKRTSPEKIRLAISKVGYDADDVAADPKAYTKLPACCKKPLDPDSAPHSH